MLVLAFVYPESTQAGRATAFAAVGSEKVSGMAASRPNDRAEAETRLVIFFSKDANL